MTLDNRMLLVIAFVVVCLSGFSTHASAFAPITGCASAIQQVLPYAQVLEDPNRLLSVEDVAALEDKRGGCRS